MTETTRNFYLERLMERAFELQAKYQNDRGTYFVELWKLFITNARNEKERKEWEAMLRVAKTMQRNSIFGPNDDSRREEVVEQVRTTLKAKYPFVKFWVVRGGRRTSRRWEVRWTNGPLEAEIKELVAPFARKDLKFEYYRKSADEAR
jgi:hypothetical protein